MALTNKLTAIADAIRGKTGKTEEMTLDQMPLEIAGIVAGGDLPAGISAVSMGEVTLSDRESSLTVEHGLGVKPDAIILYIPNFAYPATEVNILGFFWCGQPVRTGATTTYEDGAIAMVISTDYTGFAYSWLTVVVDSFRFTANRPSSVYYYKPGYTYRWCAVKFAEV